MPRWVLTRKTLVKRRNEQAGQYLAGRAAEAKLERFALCPVCREWVPKADYSPVDHAVDCGGRLL